MPSRGERFLDKWIDAGLLDATTADRIREYELAQERSHGLRWPVLLAIALGGLLLCSGVLLFVAAHWDELSPALRFGLVLSMVAVFHCAGALTAERFPPLAITLHTVGTACLGAGIFLAGQIFHLQEHWPGGVLLWALGSWIALALFRDWPHVGLVAILTPFWLAGEWSEATQGMAMSGKIIEQGLLFLSISYLSAVVPGKETAARKVLMWIGGICLIPLAASVPFGFMDLLRQPALSAGHLAVGVCTGLAVPLVISWRLRGRAVWLNGVAALWVVLLGFADIRYGRYGNMVSSYWDETKPYVMWAVGALLLIGWGLRESRKERINLGIAGFALTVLAFYFSSVMDKLDRAFSLIILGLLFVLGGWLLERVRRRLVAKIEKDRP